MDKQLLWIIALFFGAVLTTQAQTLNELSGTASGESITSRSYNAMYGDSTGRKLTTGSQNTLVGFGAGKNSIAPGMLCSHWAPQNAQA